MGGKVIRVSAGPVTELPPGSSTVVTGNGREIAVFNVGGALRAVDHRCLHRGGPLARGYIRDGVVVCPWHWWRYDLATGCRPGRPAPCLETYDVAVEDGEVLVRVPPADGSLQASLRELLLRHATETARSGPTAPTSPTGTVEGVVLDMGGVVYQTPFELMDVVERDRRLPAGTLPRGPFGSEPDPDYAAVGRGAIDERTYWRRKREDLAANGTDFDVYDAVGPYWADRKRPEVLGALARIRRRYRLAVLTNDAADWLGEGWRQTWELAELFDAMVDAGELGLKKPAIAVYAHTASALGTRPRRCLFVDDLEVNLAGARRAGMDTFRFDVTDPGRSVAGLLAELGLPHREEDTP